jgi:hypothetical protein
MLALVDATHSNGRAHVSVHLAIALPTGRSSLSLAFQEYFLRTKNVSFPYPSNLMLAGHSSSFHKYVRRRWWTIETCSFNRCARSHSVCASCLTTIKCHRIPCESSIEQTSSHLLRLVTHWSALSTNASVLNYSKRSSKHCPNPTITRERFRSLSCNAPSRTRCFSTTNSFVSTKLSRDQSCAS